MTVMTVVKRVRRYALGVCLALIAIAVFSGPSPAWGQNTPASAGPVDAALIEDLVVAYHVLTEQGIMDGLGHVSVRHPENPNRFLISRSLATSLVGPDDIVELDLDGVPVDADTPLLYLERFIHGEIYRMRPDVNAVVHNHSPNVVSFGMGTIPLQPVNQSAGFILDGVPVFDYRNLDIEGDLGVAETNLVNTIERGNALAETLGTSPASLMRNHGIVVVGRSIPMALGRSLYLEINAGIQTNALMRGGEIRYLEAEGAYRESVTQSDFARQWELWKRDACVSSGVCRP